MFYTLSLMLGLSAPVPAHTPAVRARLRVASEDSQDALRALHAASASVDALTQTEGTLDASIRVGMATAEDALREAIVLTQQASAYGNHDAVDDAVWSLQVASATLESSAAQMGARSPTITDALHAMASAEAVLAAG